MALPLTPQIVAAAFDFLRATPPFKALGLPPSDEVKFTVNRHRTWLGSCLGGPTSEIAVSSHIVGHTDTLLRVVAHEQIHLYQYLSNTETAKVTHNAAFYRLAKRACKYHGWDERIFV